MRAGRADPEIVEVDRECLRVLVVVGMQGKTPVQRRYRAQDPKPYLAAPSSGYGSELQIGATISRYVSCNSPMLAATTAEP
jgi:hypothetical protein